MSPPARRQNECPPPTVRRRLEASEAAPRMRAQQVGLVDVSGLLRDVGDVCGMRLVLTVPGNPDCDGRHLLIAANEAGEAFFFLNSQSKSRRAHMGLGLWCSGAFLIGPSKPIQRWKGHRQFLDALISQLDDLRTVKETLAAWKCL